MYNIKDATIVDVRTPEEFEQAHFPGAVNIPLDQVQSRLEEFKKIKKPIITYCRSGARSSMAIGILKQSGVEKVQNGGGLDDLLLLNKSENDKLVQKTF